MQIEIAPDEVDTVALFFALGTQWRWIAVPMSGAILRVGLDYAALAVTAVACGVTMTPAIFADIRVMEGAALSVMSHG